MENIDMIFDELNSLLDEKIKEVNIVLELTQEQKESIDDNDSDGLLDIIKKKQSSIDRITIIDKDFNEKFDQYKKSSDDHDLDKNLLKEIQDKIQSVYSCMKDIEIIETENKGLLNQKMNELKSKIKQLNSGRTGIAAYSNKILHNNGLYIDKKE